MPTVPFSVLLIGSTSLDAVCAGTMLALFGARSAERKETVLGLRSAVWAMLSTGLFFLLRLPIASRFGLKRFGIIHAVYLDLVVLIPLVALVLLVAEHLRVLGGPWWRLTPPVRWTAVASLAMIPVGLYASWIEPFRLCLETADVRLAPDRAGRDLLKVGVLTDLQTNRVTDYERNAVARLMAQAPDLILIPGDIFQGLPDEFAATAADLHDLFARLSAPGGVYLVLGDTDGPGYHLIEEILPGTEVRLLINDFVRVAVGDRRLTIGGIELNYHSQAARTLVRRLEEAEGPDDIRIVLAHRPDVVLGLTPRSRIDLVVAGHTHGGQIVIPGFGPPMTLTSVPRTVATGGLHAIERNAIYVSRGVGCERGQAPRIRFFCAPEISLLTLGGAPSRHERLETSSIAHDGRTSERVDAARLLAGRPTR